MSARGRGRARGRGAPKPPQAEAEEPSRPGPGSAAQAVLPPAPVPVHVQSAAAPPPSASRGQLRSGGDAQSIEADKLAQAASVGATGERGRTQHPAHYQAQQQQGQGDTVAADVAAAQRGMAAVRIDAGAGRDGQQTRRRGALLYISEPRTKPEHITDKRGTAGEPIKLISNLYKLNRTTNFHLYQYHVSFNPEVPSKGMRRSMMKDHVDVLGSIYMFDGMILFLPIRLELESTQVFSVRRTDESRIMITIRFTNEIPPTDPTCLQLYNIIFKRILTQNKMRAIGRNGNYYNPEDAVKIPQHKLEVWPGFATSILQFETSTMLIADVSHKILHGVTALDAMYDMFQRNKGQAFKEMCAKKLIGQIVLTRYNNKTYRVDDIDWDQNPQSKFQKSNATEISYVDYYKTAYNIDITDMKQPLLLSMPKAKDKRRGQEGPLCILPELCSLTGLADEVRADFNIMKDLAVHTRIGPGDRVKRLEKFIADINNNPLSAKEMRDWNLEFSKTLLTMTGRRLPTEKIYQHNPNMAYSYNKDTADWSREMRGQQLINAAHLDNWVMIFHGKDQANASDLYSTLQKVCPPMGMRIQKPTIITTSDDSTGAFVRSCKDNISEHTNMVLVVLPSNRKDRYDAIKTICCIDQPVPSQVVLSRTLSKKQMLMSVATKIAIQLNVKMGGEVWGVEIPIKNTMVVGIDTYHDSAKKGRSVGAFIASMNQTLTRYYSRCAFQSNHEELQNALKVCMQAALKNYHAVNNVLPERIIVYRDGVGDGQLETVFQHEVSQLTGCFASVGEAYAPKFAVIVVKKRINSRFFSFDRNQFGNPPPGTIIDTEATRPEWYDFFLVSQSVRQGTVSPTHFNVIYDTTGFKPDHLQRLSYKLCHLYYNWPGTIRVPAPCQYAHKMAFLVGQSLHKDPSLVLANKLFYL